MAWLTQPTLPTAPNLPSSQEDDLQVLAGAIADWNNYILALQPILSSYQTDPTFAIASQTVQKSTPGHIWDSNTGGQDPATGSLLTLLNGFINGVNQQNGIINNINALITTAQNNVTTLQAQYNSFANSSAGGQEENQQQTVYNTQLTGAQTQLAAQNAATAAATAAAENQQMIVTAAVIVSVLIVITVIFLIIRHKIKKAKKAAE